MTIAVKTFDSDIDALYTMMDEAWAADYAKEPRLDFSAAFLRWHFDAPGTDRELIVAAYDGDAVVGLGTSFPRMMVLNGEPLRATLSTFFTVDVDYRRQRLGWRLVEERLRRMREKGVQCTFVYLPEGHASQPLYERLGRETDARVLRLHRTAFRIRLLDEASVSPRTRAAWGDAMVRLPEVPQSPTIRPLCAADLSRCRELLNRLQQQVPLARVWESDAELAWQIAEPPFAQTLVAEIDGQVEGLLNWYVINRIGKTTVPVAMVDQFYFDGLDESQRRALVAAGLRAMAKQDCVVANLDTPVFSDESAFTALGFVAFEAYLSLYAVILDAKVELTGLDRVYLDAR